MPAHEQSQNQQSQEHQSLQEDIKSSVKLHSQLRANGAPEEQLQRLFAVTACRTQVELADLLGISVNSVRHTIKNVRTGADIPAAWLVTVSRNRGVPPEWILTGTGPHSILDIQDGHAFSRLLNEHYVNTMCHDASLSPQERLRTFSTEILLFEILHREHEKFLCLKSPSSQARVCF